MQGDEKRIPDLVVFVNGIPVVVLDFKSAVKEETTIMDAYKQLAVRYRRDIPMLFKYNAFVVISDGVNNRFGSLFADYEFFYAWRKVEQSDRSTDGINSLYTMVQGLFRKERLLEVIHNFIFVPDTPKGETKIVCRYPQYFAATALYHNILQHSHLNDGDGKGGTYFGATGCGKSFTMLFLARLLMKSRELHSPTLLFITDRTDLDDQLSKQVLNARQFIGDDTIRQVESRAQLGELLRGRTSGGVFLTTIQKFSEDINLLSERANIICISDEAHRTQTGIGMKLRVTTGEYNGANLRNQGWVNNSNIALNFKPLKGMNIQLHYFCITPQHFAQFTTRTIHYMNIGLKQSFLKNELTVSALLTDVFNTRRWDIVSDNNIYSLVNNSKNRSRMFWLGITFNFNSFKPATSKQKQEEDRSVIRIGD